MPICTKIRRLCLVEGRKVSEVSREFNLSRTTIYKYLNNAPSEPEYQRSVPIVCPKLDKFKPQLINLLEVDAARSVRERRNAFNCMKRLSCKGIEGLMTAFNGLSKRGRITRGHVLNKHLCHWFLHQAKPVSLIGHMNKSFWVGLVSRSN